MSARSRGRINSNQDADEERRLWKEIREKSKDIDSKVARSNQIGHEIIQVETQQAALIDAQKPSDASLDERLEKLYRENLKLCEDVQQLIEGRSDSTNLLDSIKILAGLREASEESAALIQASQGQRTSSTSKVNRAPKKAGNKVTSAAATAAPAAQAIAPVSASTEDGAIGPGGDDVSAAPSPRINLSALGNRLNSKDKSSRSGSIATTREASVKIEDGAESVASSADGSSSVAGKTSVAGGSGGSSRPTNRLVLRQGEIVFCRHDPKNYDGKKGAEAPEGDGILCRVTNVIGEGKQRRYEVQDADTSGLPPPPQRASVSQLIQIPENNKGLSDLPKGKQVLAQYPDTTTFYKAEVNEHWKLKDMATNEKGEMVKLNFQDDEAPRAVERRFVLTEK